MRRFFVQSRNIFKDKFYLDDKIQINHIRTVLRLDANDKIELFDGSGKIYECEIISLRKQQISGNIINAYSENIDLPHIALAQAFPKGNKLDDIVRMSTEVGISEFYFFESDYSVIKLKNYNIKKNDRFHRIIIEAARQSERTTIPTINDPLSFDEILQLEYDQKIILHSRNVNNSQNLVSLKKQFSTEDTILILIGPEGGFSESEIELAKDHNFYLGYLNLPILRTETAGIVASSILLSV
jgi:16S rRNA (uracil1498-N3)-methyltransferase